MATLAALVTWCQVGICSPWQINAGGYFLNPRLDGASLPGVPGSGLDVTSDLQPGMSVTAHLPGQLALEVFISPPFALDLVATGTAAPLGVVGHLDTWGPVLIAQWRAGRDSWPLRPLLGVGAAYVVFLDETTTGSLSNLAGGTVALELDNTWSLVWQIGAEFRLTDHWRGVLTASATSPDTEARLALPSGPVTLDMNIDAWAFALSLGYRF